MGEQLERVASTAPATTRPPALALYSDDDLELIRRFVAPKSTDHELAFFLEYAHARDLNPFEGELVGVSRWNAKEQREVMTIQVTVRGERTLAERTGLYGGQDPPEWCGPDGRWLDVWLDTEHPPAAARVAVYRKDWPRPAVGVARYASYVQLNKNKQPVGLWAHAPDLMLAKCAEAAALRKAFSRGRQISDASKVSMEARQVGLDDDGRHELVERVTDGRTNSTRELTDEEMLEVRAEIARLSDTVDVEPEAEVVEEESPAGCAHPWPWTKVDRCVYCEACGQRLYLGDLPKGPEEAEATLEVMNALSLKRRALIEELVPRARALEGEARTLFQTWLDSSGIGQAKKVKDYTLDELQKVAEALTEFEKPVGEEPL